MKFVISIIVILFGILGVYYSYSEFQNIKELKQTIEYKTNQTIDNLAQNYLGIERENIFEKELKGRHRQTAIILTGSIILIIAGIINLISNKFKISKHEKTF